MVDKCIKIFDYFKTIYPILKNVELTFKEIVTINGMEVDGVTHFKDDSKGAPPIEIQVSTNIVKRVKRSEKSTIYVFLHELSHAVIDYSVCKTTSAALPSYSASNDSSNTKIQHRNRHDRKRKNYRNQLDSDHDDIFWKTYVEVMIIASKNKFIDIDHRLINVDYVKKIDNS